MCIVDCLLKFLPIFSIKTPISVKQIQYDKLAGVKSTVFNIRNGLNLSNAINFSYKWCKKNHSDTSIIVFRQKRPGQFNNHVLSRFWMDEFPGGDLGGYLDSSVIDFCFVELDHYNGRNRFEIIIQDGVN